jgi:peroxiredoxin
MARWKAAMFGMMLSLAGNVAATTRVGQPAPNFTIRTIDGKTVSLADLRGQVVILNFWATWCVPCKKELPTLDAFYRAVADHGLRVFAVTTEDSIPYNQLKPIFAMLAISPVRYMKGPYHPLQGIPTNYVIDRSGVIRYAKANAFDLQALNEIVIPLLNEPAPPAAPAIAN